MSNCVTLKALLACIALALFAAPAQAGVMQLGAGSTKSAPVGDPASHPPLDELLAQRLSGLSATSSPGSFSGSASSSSNGSSLSLCGLSDTSTTVRSDNLVSRVDGLAKVHLPPDRACSLFRPPRSAV